MYPLSEDDMEKYKEENTEVCGFTNNRMSDSILFCGKIDTIYKNKFKNFVKLQSGIYIHKDNIFDAKIKEEENYRKAFVNYEDESAEYNEDEERDTIFNITDFFPYSGIYISDTASKFINENDMKEDLRAIHPSKLSKYKTMRKEVCTESFRGVVCSTIDKLSSNNFRTPEYVALTSYDYSRYAKNYANYRSLYDKEEVLKHRKKNEGKNYYLFNEPIINLADESINQNELKPLTDIEFYNARSKSQLCIIKNNAPICGFVKKLHGKYSINGIDFTKNAYPLSLLDQKNFNIVGKNNDIVQIDMTKFKDEYIRDEENKSYSDTCTIKLNYNAMKDADVDLLMKSAIEYTVKHKREISFGMNFQNNPITPIIEGNCRSVYAPTNSSIIKKKSKKMVDFHTHPINCSYNPSIVDIKNAIENNVYKSLIASKCDDDYIVTEINFGKLQKNKDDYEKIKNAIASKNGINFSDIEGTMENYMHYYNYTPIFDAIKSNLLF